MDSTLLGRDVGARRATLIGVASGLGAPDNRGAEGPAALRAAGLAERLRACGLTAEWGRTLTPPPDASNVPAAIASLAERLAGQVSASVTDGERFAVIGGDHSCAVGTWSGAANALAGRGRLGLIWVDAHMDSHTPETTPSGTYHGMPLACLLGFGDPALTGLARPGPALDPRHVCLVGVRSYEPAEPVLLDRLGVRVFSMDEIAGRGLAAVMREAAAIALNGTAGAGISIDLDAVDPACAPGVGSPVAGGLDGKELADAIRAACQSPRFVGCEVVEYNPALDRDGVTAALAIDLVAACFGGGRA